MRTDLHVIRQRVLHGWTVQRALYALIGFVLMVQAWLDAQWMWMIFGAYYFSMGVFSFGCAAGTCSIPTSSIGPENETALANVSKQ